MWARAASCVWSVRSRIESGLNLYIPLTQYRFQLQGNQVPVFEQPVVAGALFRGAEVAF
ncbi:hypothetical protein [Sorangium sp. So ce1000]|uniref:hypothetical protein n=1 Tax=Sorangium sp. So ce1000 TaxID=3133325 RepID=UPI003F5FFFF6